MCCPATSSLLSTKVLKWLYHVCLARPLWAENEESLTSSMKFSLLMRAKPAGDTATSASGDVLHLFNLACTGTARLLPAVDRFEHRLKAVQPMKENSTDRFLYDAETAGWHLGLIMTLPSSPSSHDLWLEVPVALQRELYGLARKKLYIPERTCLCRRISPATYNTCKRE